MHQNEIRWLPALGAADATLGTLARPQELQVWAIVDIMQSPCPHSDTPRSRVAVWTSAQATAGPAET